MPYDKTTTFHDTVSISADKTVASHDKFTTPYEMRPLMTRLQIGTTWQRPLTTRLRFSTTQPQPLTPRLRLPTTWLRLPMTTTTSNETTTSHDKTTTSNDMATTSHDTTTTSRDVVSSSHDTSTASHDTAANSNNTTVTFHDTGTILHDNDYDLSRYGHEFIRNDTDTSSYDRTHFCLYTHHKSILFCTSMIFSIRSGFRLSLARTSRTSCFWDSLSGWLMSRTWTTKSCRKMIQCYSAKIQTRKKKNLVIASVKVYLLPFVCR